MIVPMQKVYIAARAADRDPLLATLRELGMVHLVPVDASRAVADESTNRQIHTLEQALQSLSGVQPSGEAPDVAPVAAAAEVLDIQRRAAEGRNRLAALYHQLEQISVWGNVRLDDLRELREQGIDVRFFSMPDIAFDAVEADCKAVVAELPGRNVAVAVVSRRGPSPFRGGDDTPGDEPHSSREKGTVPFDAVLPEQATPMPLPQRDAPTIRAEAKEIDQSLHQDTDRLHELAALTPRMRAELVQLQQQAEETIAVRGAAADEALFAVQGWLPEENVATLDERVTALGVPVLIQTLDPDADEQPPTLVRPPAWARPIEGLFNMLGTVPGYREFDVSIPFLIVLPIFTAILISDGGYGLLLLLGPALAYPWVSRAIGARFTQLLMIVGAVSVVWGLISNAFFGFKVLPDTLVPVDLAEESRRFMMELSFTLGAIHLSLAQLWQAVRYFPDLRWLNKVGWAVFIWGMYGVVKMFVLQGPMGWHTPWPYLLSVGAALAILFASPSRNPIKMLGLGLAQFPLSMLSAFSDVISYVRLMAVGVASSILAVSFNDMAFEVGFLPLTIVILVFGHGLNVGLALIAMFAHGVRLNMLEFGNNLGMEWVGYPYKPFSRRT